MGRHCINDLYIFELTQLTNHPNTPGYRTGPLLPADLPLLLSTTGREPVSPYGQTDQLSQNEPDSEVVPVHPDD